MLPDVLEVLQLEPRIPDGGVHDGPHRGDDGSGEDVSGDNAGMMAPGKMYLGMAPTAGMMAPGKMYLGVIGANDGSHRGNDGSGEDVSGGNRCKRWPPPREC